jgi:hypothetical protein
MPAQEPLFQLFSFPCLGSTMDEARALAREGFTGAAIVRADTQTSGRGRIGGRTWVDAPKLSLLMTILLPADFKEAKALPLRAGLGVVRALEETAALNETVMIQRDGKPAARSYKFRSSGPMMCSCNRIPERAGGKKRRGHTPRRRGVRQTVRHPLRKRPGQNSDRHRHEPAQPPPCTAHIRAFSLQALRKHGVVCPRLSTIWTRRHTTWLKQVIDTLSDPQWHSENERRLWGRGSTLQFLAGHPRARRECRGCAWVIDEDGALF